MLLSILTATLNVEGTIRDCLASVAEQELPAGVDVEHLVLDGGSGDGTVELLREWQATGERRTFWSEPDEGLYAALNSGLQRASGDLIGILNADDYYPSPDVLASIAEHCAEESVMGCYGDLIYVTSDSTRADYRIVRDWRAGGHDRRSFWWGWMPPHPTLYVRRAGGEQTGPFRTDLGSAADYEWMLRTMVKEAIPLSYLPKRLVAMRQGGMSNRSLTARLKANRHDRRAWTVNGLRPYPWTLLCKPLRKIGQFLPF